MQTNYTPRKTTLLNLAVSTAQADILKRLLAAELHDTGKQIANHGTNPSLMAHQQEIATLKVSIELIRRKYEKITTNQLG